jgi:hypothetical protein
VGKKQQSKTSNPTLRWVINTSLYRCFHWSTLYARFGEEDTKETTNNLQDLVSKQTEESQSHPIHILFDLMCLLVDSRPHCDICGCEPHLNQPCEEPSRNCNKCGIKTHFTEKCKWDLAPKVSPRSGVLVFTPRDWEVVTESFLCVDGLW